MALQDETSNLKQKILTIEPYRVIIHNNNPGLVENHFEKSLFFNPQYITTHC